MYVKVGQYTGTGASNPQTGFGFAPVAGIIKRHGSTSSAVHIIKTGGVTHHKVMGLNATGDDTTVTLDADGFTALGITLETNTDTGTYDYVMIGAAAADMAVFEYTGDTTDNKDYGAFTFTPDMVWVMPSSTARMAWRCDQMAGDVSHSRWDNATTTNHIQAVGAGTIQVGTALNAAIPYYVAVFKKAAGVFATAEYTGDGNDNRDIAHGLGATPVFTYIQTQTVSNQVGALAFSVDAADTTHAITPAADFADGIQSMGATNVQVGANATVNLVTGSPVYSMFTFGQSLPAAGSPGNSGNAPGRGRGNANPGGGGKGGGGSPIGDPTRRAFKAMRRRTR